MAWRTLGADARRTALLLVVEYGVLATSLKIRLIAIRPDGSGAALVCSEPLLNPSHQGGIVDVLTASPEPGDWSYAKFPQDDS